MCMSTTRAPAVEAGVEAGRPYRIRITHFGLDDAHTTGAGAGRSGSGSSARSWPSSPEKGLAGLYAEAGADHGPRTSRGAARQR